MSLSNRTYACVVCGELRRAPWPPGLRPPPSSASERERQRTLLGQEPPEADWTAPVPYGHWRGAVVPQGYVLPAWLSHCGKPMFLLGKRASQAATEIKAGDRLAWMALGARVSHHPSGKRWRPILKAAELKNAFPLV